MIEILTVLHKYVPLVQKECQVSVGEDTDMVSEAAIPNIFLEGDQLSQARARTALKIKHNGENPSTRLEGLIPVVEDWHAKLTLFEVGHVILLVTNYVNTALTFLIGYMEVFHVTRQWEGAWDFIPVTKFTWEN